MPNRAPIEEKLSDSGEKLRDVSAIDARLSELEQEKQRLITLREELLKPKPIPSN